MVRGVAFKKSFSYAGFEQQPKSFKNPKIVCLNIELELKAEKDNAEVRVEQVSVRNPSLSSSALTCLGIPSYRRRRMANHFPKTRSNHRNRRKSRPLQTPHRRPRHPILCRQRHFLCWSRHRRRPRSRCCRRRGQYSDNHKRH
jgi:hypothetical protein